MAVGGPAHQQATPGKWALSDLAPHQEKGRVLLLGCEGSARSAHGHVGI